MTRRSRASLERRLAKKREQKEPSLHVKLSGQGKLRYSRIAALLSPDGQAEFEAERKKLAQCRKHGELEDPACAMAGEGDERRIVFICPWCSGPKVQELWEKEGAA